MITKIKNWFQRRRDAKLLARRQEAWSVIMEETVGPDAWRAVAPLVNRLMHDRSPAETTEQLTRLFRYITQANSDEEKWVIANCLRNTSRHIRPKRSRKH